MRPRISIRHLYEIIGGGGGGGNRERVKDYKNIRRF